MKTKPSLLLFLALGVLLSLQPAIAQQTTAFTYQGQLRDGGTNANGSYGMTFKLYDAASGGGQIGSTVTNSPTLANGLFSVNLDFGDEAFDGDARWLDITAQSGTNAPETLAPRVQVLPAPYAIYAAYADEAGQADEANLAFNANAVNGFGASSTPMGNTLLPLDANGGLTLANGIATFGSIILPDFAGGNASISANEGVVINGGLTLNSNSIILSTPNGGGLSITARDGLELHVNGGLTVNHNLTNVSGITTLGLIHLAGPSGTWPIFANNQGVNLNGVNISAANGVIFPTSGGGSVGITTSGNNIFIPAGNLVMNNNIACVSIVASSTITCSSLNQTSDRNLKERFTPINSREILERVARLPISRWNFKTDDADPGKQVRYQAEALAFQSHQNGERRIPLLLADCHGFGDKAHGEPIGVAVVPHRGRGPRGRAGKKPVD